MLAACMPRIVISEQQAGPDAEMPRKMSFEQSGCLTDVYDFTFKAGRRNLSGIIAVRPAEGGGVRAVAATYFGMSLFDMTVKEDSHVMNSCAGFLDNEKAASFIADRLRKRLL